jgi:hypothetical protein
VRARSSAAFLGSLNETREGWKEHYELVWEDSSAEGIAWLEEEFRYLWERGVPLPDAIVEEVGRCASRARRTRCALRRRRQVRYVFQR